MVDFQARTQDSIEPPASWLQHPKYIPLFNPARPRMTTNSLFLYDAKFHSMYDQWDYKLDGEELLPARERIGLLAYNPLSPHFDLALTYMMRWIPGFYIIGDADEIMALPLNRHDPIYDEFWEKRIMSDMGDAFYFVGSNPPTQGNWQSLFNDYENKTSMAV
jgi:hypothetical protein